MHILITRPEPDASEMRALLMSEGHTADVAPLLGIELLPPPADVFDDIAALVVTSRNGLRSLAAYSAVGRLKSLPLFVVGRGTAAAASEMGFKNVSVGPAAAKDLVPVIITGLADCARPCKVLHLSGDKVSFDLRPPLSEAGLELRRAAVYRSAPIQYLPPDVVQVLRERRYDAVVLMSPLTADTFVHLVEREGLADEARHPAYLCLSRGIADRLQRLDPRRIKIAARPNAEDMLALVRDLTPVSE